MSQLRLSACSAALLLAAVSSALADPRFEGVDQPIRDGDVPPFVLSGLTPEAEVRLIAERSSPWGPNQAYRASAVFRADASGMVDPTRQAPVRGDWLRVDPFALLWAADRVEASGLAAEDPLIIGLGADLDLDGVADVTAQLDMRGGLDGVEEIAVSSGLPGAYFLRPAGEGPFPAIIALGGSEGGDRGSRSLAAPLVARGYAVLGLPYYSPTWFGRPQQIPELPVAFSEIPLDTAEAAMAWLVARDDVRADAIAIYGVSKGAEFALAAASRIDGFAAVAAIVPTDVIWEGWGAGTTPGQNSSFSWRGEPLDFVPYEGMTETIAALARGEQRSLRPAHEDGRAAHPERVAPARIAVETIEEPVYLLGGMLDNVWASGPMTVTLIERREAAGLPTFGLVYEDAGHGLSGPPTTPSGAADAAAKTEAFPHLLAFFANHLGGRRE
jgi:hypothetical protein